MQAARFEEAKSARAGCKTCRAKIAKSELRVGVEVRSRISLHYAPFNA
jgi:hypothetical protein